VPGGGLSPDHTRWIPARSGFFLSVRVLSCVFRGKFVAGLRRVFRKRQLVFHGACSPLNSDTNFAAFVPTLFQQDWVVYAKPPFGGAEHVLHHLARYTHRVAISNHRLVSVSDNSVRFRWKDHAHGHRQRTDDSVARRVPSPFPAACAAQRVSAHSLFRMARQPQAPRTAPTLPLPAPPARLGSGCCDHGSNSCALELPKLRRPMHVVERLTASQIYFAGLAEVHAFDTS